MKEKPKRKLSKLSKKKKRKRSKKSKHSKKLSKRKLRKLMVQKKRRSRLKALKKRSSKTSKTRTSKSKNKISRTKTKTSKKKLSKTKSSKKKKSKTKTKSKSKTSKTNTKKKLKKLKKKKLKLKKRKLKKHKVRRVLTRIQKRKRRLIKLRKKKLCKRKKRTMKRRMKRFHKYSSESVTIVGKHLDQVQSDEFKEVEPLPMPPLKRRRRKTRFARNRRQNKRRLKYLSILIYNSKQPPHGFEFSIKTVTQKKIEIFVEGHETSRDACTIMEIVLAMKYNKNILVMGQHWDVFLMVAVAVSPAIYVWGKWIYSYCTTFPYITDLYFIFFLLILPFLDNVPKGKKTKLRPVASKSVSFETIRGVFKTFAYYYPETFLDMKKMKFMMWLLRNFCNSAKVSKLLLFLQSYTKGIRTPADFVFYFFKSAFYIFTFQFLLRKFLSTDV